MPTNTLTSVPITDLLKGPGVTFSANNTLVSRLKKANIKTLADIRRAGGIPEKERWPKTQQPVAERLEAHAYLNLLSEDIALNDQLIAAGFCSFRSIATLPQASFVEQVKAKGIVEEKAAALHAKASAAEAYLTQAITAARAEQASYAQTSPAAKALGRDYDPDCEVKACNSAVSPLAYLAELLVYARENISGLGESPLEKLEELLYQPFGRFTNACEEVDRQVRQARIATEVLRRKGLRNEVAEKDYCFQAYQTLLTRIGTSYDELRRSKSADPKKRRALAERLGIGLRDDRPDELDRLLADKENLSEAWLEEMFGLVDTRRDELTDIIIIGDYYKMIKSGKIVCLYPKELLNSDGKLYGKYIIQKSASSCKVEINLFKYLDLNPGFIVASGSNTVETTQKIVTLEIVEQNSSGISGSFRISLDTSSNKEATFSIPALPALLSWRLKQLRKQWCKKDAFNDPYSNGELPVIDPDLIGPEDMFQSQYSNPAYLLWQKRRQWVDEQLERFINVRGLTDAGLLNSKLELLSKQVSYKRMDLQKSDNITPWAKSVSISDLQQIRKKLENPNQRIAQEQWITNHFLSLEGFLRLAELASKAGEGKENLQIEETYEINSILTQVIKNSFRHVWIEEKAVLAASNEIAVPLSPSYFWKALSEPSEGEWSPVLQKLRPVVDPEKVKTDDLAAGPAGQMARQIFETRKIELSKAKANIEQAYVKYGLEGALIVALGRDQSWMVLLNQLWEKLASAPEAARQEIKDKFHISQEEFENLYWWSEKEKAQQSIDPEELSSLLSLLATCWKYHFKNAEWASEETQRNLQYWQIFRSRMSKWRSSVEKRGQWQYFLKQRSSRPIIDPDLIDKLDIRSDSDETKVFEYWQKRSEVFRKSGETQAEEGTLRKAMKTFQNASLSFTWGKPGNEHGAFNIPLDVATDSNGNVYVVDSNNHRIQKFSANGIFQFPWGQRGNADHEFNSPAAIAIDAFGAVFVAGSHENRVQKFDYQGALVWKKEIPHLSSGNTKLSGIAVNKQGNILVSDWNNKRIIEIDAAGDIIESWGEPGSNNGQFNYPSDIAVDADDNIYVVDAQNNNVQKFSPDGDWLASWGTSGQGNGQFNQPISIAINPIGHLFVADRLNNRIQQFDLFGNFINSYPREQVGVYGGLAIGKNLNLYFTDTRWHTIHSIDIIHGFGAIVEYSIRTSLSTLLLLNKSRIEGIDITKHLDQLLLSHEAFLRLFQFFDIVSSGGDLIFTEWEELHDLLLSVIKQRDYFANWKDQETTYGFSLTPDYFNPDPDRETKKELTPWLATREDRWDWEEKLQNRIEQEKNTYAALAEAVDKAEEHTIVQLRDTLIEKSGTAAQALSQQLLVDMEISPCRKTTRISAAINTLQKLFFLLQTEQNTTYFTDLELNNRNTTFEQHWKWLGSYETWRAAVGVFLYPENVLLPGLKRDKTKNLSQVIDLIRQRVPIGKERTAIAEYSGFFKDICSLKIEGLIDISPGNSSDQFLLIAKADNSGILYFSFLDLTMEVGESQSDWYPIPEDSGNIQFYEMIGVFRYKDNLGKLTIALVYLIRDEENNFKISIQKNDPSSKLWGEMNLLEIQPSGTLISIKTYKNYNDRSYNMWIDTNTISVFYQNGENKVFRRKLSFIDETWMNDWELMVDFDRRLTIGPLLAISYSYPENIGIIISFAFKQLTQNAEWFVGCWFASGNNPPYQHRQVIWGNKNVDFISLCTTEDEFIDIETLGDHYYVFLNSDCKYFKKPRLVGNNIDIGNDFNDGTINFNFKNLEKINFYNSGLCYRTGREEDFSYFEKIKEDFSILKSLSISSSNESQSLASQIDFSRKLSGDEIKNLKLTQENLFVSNKLAPGAMKKCLHEAFFFLPLTISLELSKQGNYQKALDWHRIIYDFTLPKSERKIYQGLIEEENLPNGQSEVDWTDPTNVHALAATRPNAYTRFTLQLIIQTLLAYADSEFTRDTSESIEKATLLYEKAEELLDSDELQPPPCNTVKSVKLNGAGKEPRTLAQILQGGAQKELAERQLLQEAHVERPLLAITQANSDAATVQSRYTASFLPKVGSYGDFGIPWNPLIQMLCLHVENNLHKIRSCRNIAGVKREVEAYAAATDVLSAMPSIGAGGQLVLPTRILPPPVPYRYEFLIDRTKQLVNIAMQMEAAYLAALEKRDAEWYGQLRARQDLQLAQAGVKLQNLRLRQAKDEITLAELQRNSAEIQFGYYEDWLNEGLTELEQWVVGLTITAGTLSATGIILQGANWWANSIQAAGVLADTAAKVSQIYATQERREMEWQMQRDLASNSIQIGDQQIQLANDGVDIAEQEAATSKLRVDHAKDIIEFLREKDTSAELYDWMQGVLRNIYSYFLQQATAMAKLAQNQLAFERQEPSPGFIQHDYWVAPSENAVGGSTEEATDRFGLTGSARLLADIYKLDQYHFDTEKRKLQLTKNISLARIAPFELQRFRETGVLTFQTLMDWFDRDFPGHYLRMIKRVRTSVIALIPPVDGIKATLTNIGVSRIVTDRNGLFQPIIAHRPPESVALTSPSNATGLFELESQNGAMMLPFEGLGVDTLWEFRLPKAANQFDYSTIADIILSIDYTALDSYDYRQLVIESLPARFSGDRPYSFRHQFADAWYELHNPEQSATPMTVTFRTRREDFPPNLERVTIQQALLYFATKDKAMDEQAVSLTFLADHGDPVALGGEAAPVDGVISTRRGNGSAWLMLQGQPVSGTWTLTLPKTGEVKRLFEEEKIEDILLVITAAGVTPAW